MTTWQRLTIYLTESEQWQGRTMYTTLVDDKCGYPGLLIQIAPAGLHRSNYLLRVMVNAICKSRMVM